MAIRSWIVSWTLLSGLMTGLAIWRKGGWGTVKMGLIGLFYQAGAKKVGGYEEFGSFFGVVLVLGNQTAVVGDSGIRGRDEGGLR